MQASESLVAAIRQFEGFRATAYQDAVGVWTLGFGDTNGVLPGQTVTYAFADLALRAELQEKAAGISRLMNPVLTQPQFDACLDFAFNLGVQALAGSSLLRYLNSGYMNSAANEFPKWDHAAGKELAGLKIRRFAERSWFLGELPVSYPTQAQQEEWLAA